MEREWWGKGRLKTINQREAAIKERALRRKVRECYRKTYMESREKEKLLDEEGQWHRLCKGPWFCLVFTSPKLSCQLWLSSVKLLPHNYHMYLEASHTPCLTTVDALEISFKCQNCLFELNWILFNCLLLSKSTCSTKIAADFSNF